MSKILHKKMVQIVKKDFQTDFKLHTSSYFIQLNCFNQKLVIKAKIFSKVKIKTPLPI